jgi:hypothetical protein
MDAVSLTPEHALCFERYQALLVALPEAEGERDHLIGHTLPLLNARYLQLLGPPKLALLQLRLEAHELRRKSEMIRSSVNRGEPVLLELIDTLIAAEMKEQREKIEREARKIEEALTVINTHPLSDADAEELKQLYHAMARMLHPDLNPGLSPSHKELWLKVSLAYRSGDLAGMRALHVLLLAMEELTNAEAPSLLEELKKKNELLQAALDRILESIETIKNSFPYTVAELMEDPAWLAGQHDMIREHAETVNAEISMYRGIIDALMNGGQA